MREIRNILYASSLCSSDTESKLLGYNPKLVGIQIQKYHRLLAKGFAKNNIDVQALSYHSGLDSLNLKGNDETENGISYHYIVKPESRLIRLKVIRESYKFARHFFAIHKDAALICDVLNFSVSLGAVLASKRENRQAFGIITDFPEQLTEGNNLNSYLIWKLIKMCSGNIILTEKMKERLPLGRTSIVLEGHVDVDALIQEKIENSTGDKICIYAGMLHRKYGIEKLVQAFIKADIDNSVLYIFGDGDYADELRKIDNKHIQYFGIVPNKEVVQYELRADLLINPRPTTEEYTKYSFPSKNMEYMVSGTPVLTTKLPGMPKEYYDYVYLFEDESIDGMKKQLQNILALDKRELSAKGKNAKEFVLNKKNNVIQAKKILDVLENNN